MNEKINDFKDKALKKADSLYNKLPLDKMNEKLNGKADVKSKKFKIIAAVVVLVLLVLGGWMIFGGGGGGTKMNGKELKYVKQILASEGYRSLTHVEFVDKAKKNGITVLAFKGQARSKNGKEKISVGIIVPRGKNPETGQNISVENIQIVDLDALNKMINDF